MSDVIAAEFPGVDFEGSSSSFRNEILFYIRKHEMIGPDFNREAMMMPVHDAIVNERDAIIYNILNTRPPVKKELKASRTESEQNIYRRMLVSRLMPFVEDLDTTDGLIREILYVHGCIRTGTLSSVDDLRKRCACLVEYTDLEDPIAVRAVMDHFGACD